MDSVVSAVEIGNRRVGPGQPCFIIAEAGVNHNGDLKLARELVELAAVAGADAVKFQTFKAERLVSAEAPKAEYQIETTPVDESQFEMLCRLELPAEAHGALQDYCREREIVFMSTPFDNESADLLHNLGVPAFKISSGDITNLPFLEYVAAKGRPIILSTGMSYLKDVDEAVKTILRSGNSKIVLLHCVSNYPAKPSDVNLKAMGTMAESFQLPVGFSDHTPGIEVALAAVALGACVIEKHFTLDRGLPGPDHRASIEPDELVAMVRGIRIVESSLGHGRKEPAASEFSTAQVARRSLVAAKDIPAGTPITSEMIAIQRPGTGLPPAMLPYFVGRCLRVDLRAGHLLQLELLV